MERYFSTKTKDNRIAEPLHFKQKLLLKQKIILIGFRAIRFRPSAAAGCQTKEKLKNGEPTTLPFSLETRNALAYGRASITIFDVNGVI